MTDSQKWLVLTLFVGSGILFYLLAPVLTPFATGALLAYLGDPVADRLEEWGLSRSNAVVVVFVVMAVLLALILLMVIPTLEKQITRLFSNLPDYLNWIKTSIVPWVQGWLGIDRDIFQVDEIMKMFTSDWDKAGGMLKAMYDSVSSSGLAIIGWVLNGFLVPVVTFYLLRDWDIMVAKIKGLIPRSIEPTFTKLTDESNEVLGSFLLGQFSVMVILGIIYSVGLGIMGLDFALLIGMAAGLVSFIPYVGTIVGVLLASIAAIAEFKDLFHLVPVMITFGVGQMLEGMLLTPLLVGDKIGLHPVAVIFAVMAGGQLFGFLGVLLALPVASVIMVLLRHAHDVYKLSELYRERGSGIEVVSDMALSPESEEKQ